MSKHVFISYSSDDKSLADRVWALLEQRGVPCWIAPRNILPGAVFDEAILDAIENAAAVVLLLSAHSNESPFVKNEVSHAFSKGKTILSFRIQDVMPGRSLEFYLARYQWIDGFLPPFEEQLDRFAWNLLCDRRDRQRPLPPSAASGNRHGRWHSGA